jgi:hemoglobin
MGKQNMNKQTDSLYSRLGGYDAITAVADNLLPRLAGDALLGRYWQNRGEDGIAREKQLLVDFLANSAGGPVYYTGRDMLLSHKGMKISQADWDAFIGHLEATLDSFNLGEPERGEVLAFIDSTREEIVE